MKHIVIVGKYYPPEFGGVERYVSDVAHAAAKKHRVTIVVHSKNSDDSIEHDGNSTIIRCATKKIVSSQPLSPSMFTHLRSLNPDLVHFNAPNLRGVGHVVADELRCAVGNHASCGRLRASDPTAHCNAIIPPSHSPSEMRCRQFLNERTKLARYAARCRTRQSRFRGELIAQPLRNQRISSLGICGGEDAKSLWELARYRVRRTVCTI